jgi:hypothetical protein
LSAAVRYLGPTASQQAGELLLARALAAAPANLGVDVPRTLSPLLNAAGAPPLNSPQKHIAIRN